MKRFQRAQKARAHRPRSSRPAKRSRPRKRPLAELLERRAMLAADVCGGMQGDYNADDVVDMLDYLAWREGIEEQAAMFASVEGVADDGESWRCMYGAVRSDMETDETDVLEDDIDECDLDDEDPEEDELDEGEDEEEDELDEEDEGDGEEDEDVEEEDDLDEDEGEEDPEDEEEDELDEEEDDLDEEDLEGDEGDESDEDDEGESCDDEDVDEDPDDEEEDELDEDKEGDDDEIDGEDDEDERDTGGLPLDTNGDEPVEAILVGSDESDKIQGNETDDTSVGGEGADLFVVTAGVDVIEDFDPSEDLLDVGDFAREIDGFETLTSLEAIADAATEVTNDDGVVSLVIDVDGDLGEWTTTLRGVRLDELNESNVFFGLEGTSVPPLEFTRVAERTFFYDSGEEHFVPSMAVEDDECDEEPDDDEMDLDESALDAAFAAM